MAGIPSFSAGWRDHARYAALSCAEPAAIAWEWLRRDPGYRAAAAGARRTDASGLRPFAGASETAWWGLHAFADPDLPATAARPVWRRGPFARVLLAVADNVGPREEQFDLGRFASLATVVLGPGGCEHVLLSDGPATLRLDLASGSLLAGPVRLSYRLAGMAALRGPLATLRGLMTLCELGRLPSPPARNRNRRLILLLRAHDALLAGANQREIAEVLLSPDAARPRWRAEVPSVRLQAQRLVAGARMMASGGYRELLRA